MAPPPSPRKVPSTPPAQPTRLSSRPTTPTIRVDQHASPTSPTRAGTFPAVESIASLDDGAPTFPTASSPPSRPRSLRHLASAPGTPRSVSPNRTGRRTPRSHSPGRSPLATTTTVLPALSLTPALEKVASSQSSVGPRSSPSGPLSPIESVGSPVDERADGMGHRGRRWRRKRGTFSIGADEDDKEKDQEGERRGRALNTYPPRTSPDTSTPHTHTAHSSGADGRLSEKDSSNRRRSSVHVAFDSGGAFEFEAPPFEKVSAGSGSKTTNSSSAKESTGEDEPPAKKTVKEHAKSLIDKVLADRHFSWIKPKLTWDDMKVVIRIAVSTWIGFLLVLIHKSGEWLGVASFFSLIVSCMIPPHQPFVQVLEVSLNTVFYTACAWAWCCIAIAIAAATRVPTDPATVADELRKHPPVEGQSPALAIIASGVYLQAGPAIVCCVFLSVGCGILMWWKVRTAPSPATFPLVLSCIMVAVTLTTAPLYGHANYASGLQIWKPIAIQVAIQLLASAVIFPQSVTSQFRRRFGGVLTPLEASMKQMEELFLDASQGSEDSTEAEHHARVVFDETDETEEEHDAKVKAWADRSDTIRTTLTSSLAGMQPLQGQLRYLPIDLSYGRLRGPDLAELFDILASMQVRASGMAFFFYAIVNKIRHTHLDSKGFNVQETITHTLSRPNSRPPSRSNSRPPSRPESVAGSRPPSRQASARDLASHNSIDNVTSVHDSDDEHGSRRASQADDGHHEHHDHHSLAHHLRMAFHKSHSKSHSFISGSHHGSLHSHKHSGSGLHLHKGSTTGLHSHKGSHISLIEHLRKAQQPVGVYESQRYMDLERDDSHDLQKLVTQLDLLSTGALPLVKTLREALTDAITWSKTKDKKRHDVLRTIQKTYGHLSVVLDEFKEHRIEVIKPYRHLFDPSHPRDEFHSIRHAGLYYCFVAQYHLIEFTDAVIKFLAKIIEVDSKRQKRRLWYPTNVMALVGEFRTSVKQKTEDGTEAEAQADLDDENHHDSDNEDDDDETVGLLGEARRRNPDYEPFKSPWMVLVSKLSSIPDLLSSRLALFAFKAGALSCLTTLPAFFKSSATFYYDNRGMWVTIMAQMTLAVYSGDTITSFLARLSATFWGILCGMAVWYIGSADGHGNPYGMGAVTAVAFPLIMFYRLYYPASPITTVVFTTSIMLVVGYSWQNGNLQKLTAASWGWDVAWRRFVCVVIGITAAWLWSVVPPSFSQKKAIRSTYAGSIMTSGRILCDILSVANDPHNQTDLTQYQKTRKDLLKARTKLSKMVVRHGNARNEVSLRGRWPEARYQGLLNTLVETMSLLAQLNHLLPQLDFKWRRALLARTRMSDPLFIGDVLAVISMTSAALKSASPLPQITPGPLVAKYHMNKHKGLDLPTDPVLHHHDDGLPVHVTVEVLESENYMRYALGVTTVYALMARLDAIVVACKTLLGENFHIGHLRVGDLHVENRIV